MATTLTTHATEQSTFVVTVKFYDEDGAAVVPTEIKWTLTDPVGNVVNNRADVEIGTPASTVDIVLSGLDLALEGYVGPYRHLTIKATYNSTLGSGLPLREAAIFEIDPLVAVET